MSSDGDDGRGRAGTSPWDTWSAPPLGQPYALGQPYGAGPPPGPWGPPPARPGPVVTAAVLGLVHGALGLLATVGFLAGGALFDDLVRSLAEADPSLEPSTSSAEVDSVRTVLTMLGLLALAWTVVMVWGSVLALRGRSRVLLVVGASISVAATGVVLLLGLVSAVTAPDGQDAAAGVVVLLLFFLAALALLVLLCLRSAGRFFAAHRQRRAFGLR